jgi:VCBS repeat-containing protein
MVSPVNDAPAVLVPAAQSTTQGTPLVFSAGGGNAIRVTDPDARSEPIQVTLMAGEGTLTLSRTTGLSFTAGDGAFDETMIFEGSLAAVNTALDGLSFATAPGFTGTGSVQVAVNDLRHSGSGVALTDADAVLVTVAPDALNEAPEVLVPNPQRTGQDTPLVLGATAGNAVTLLDDAGSDPVEVTLTVDHGTVSLTRSTGPETQANTYETDEQRFPAVAATPDGDYVVVWQSKDQDGDGEGIFAQRYSAAGLPIGPETRVSATTAGNQSNPVVAIAPGGAFVVAWVSAGQDGDGNGVFARRFAADGSPLADEFLVNTTVIGSQSAPSVAIDGTGAFVIAWQGPDGGGNGVFFQRFDSAGVAQGEETLAHDPGGEQTAPVVGRDGAGSFVIAWQAPDASGLGVFARRFDADGVAVGDAFAVNTGATASDQKLPAVAVNGDGTLLIAWQGKDSNGDGVFAKVYAADGSVAIPDLLVNTTEGGNQQSPAVTLNAAGRFAVAWQGVDASGLGVYGRLYDAAGTPAGAELRLNATTGGDQTAPAVAMTGDGDLIGAWTSSGQDADRTAVMTQRFLPDGSLVYLTGEGHADALVTLRGTLADVNAALDGMTFTPAPGFVGVASIGLAVDDLGNAGAGDPLGASDTLSIVVGNGPLLDLDADNSSGLDGGHFATTFVAGGAAVRVADTDAVLSSPGTGKLTSLTVTLTNPLDGADEVLTADTSGTLITASYAGHVLTLSNLDTVANYKKVLGTVRYQDTDAFPDPTTRLIEIVAVSGTLRGNTAVAQIGVTAFETDAPTTAANAGSTAEEGGTDPILPGELRYVDAQPAADVAYLVTGAPAHGHLELSTNPDVPVLAFTQADVDAGRLRYRHDGSETLADSFTFDVRDALGNTAAGETFAVTVSPVNDAPVASLESYSLEEDTSLSALVADGVLANDSDAEGDALSAVLVTGPAHGTLALSPDGGFTYTPDPEYHGPDAFTYIASDGSLGSGVAAVTLTVHPVNDTPLAAADVYATTEDTPLTVPGPGVLANDSDPDGDALAAELVTGPAHGTLALSPDGGFTYTPDPEFAGTDGFTYRVSDGALASHTSVTLTVWPVNDGAPRADDDEATTQVDTALTLHVLHNDTPSDGAVLSVFDAVSAEGGQVVKNPDGSFTYTPPAGFHGQDRFIYTLQDTDGETDRATVTLRVDLLDQPLAVLQNTGLDLDVGGRVTVTRAHLAATDPDAGPAGVRYVVVTPPDHGVLYLDGTPLRRGDAFQQADLDVGRVRYVHSGAGGPLDSFTVALGDGGTVAPVPLTVAVRVQAPEETTESTGDWGEGVTAATPDDALVLLATTPDQAGLGQSGPAVRPDGGAAGPAAAADATSTVPATAAGPAASAGVGPDESSADGESGKTVGGGAGADSGTGTAGDAGALTGGLGRTPAHAALARIAAQAQNIEDLLAELATGRFRGELDDLRDGALEELELEGNIVASSVAMATGLSVGYVIWLVRGGVLLSTLLSSMPAWRLVDPLPVLAYLGKDGADDDGESLESLVGRKATPTDGRPAAATD